MSAVSTGYPQSVFTASEQSAEPVRAASRLSQWCDRFIEIGWISSLVVAPLFFNIYSSRVFEPDKITTVRSIALMMAAFWLIKWFEERKNPTPGRAITWRTPLLLPTMILVVVYMLSTALSVAPRTSLLGSYQRLQGTYSTFSYIVIFLMMIQGMRTRVQVNRLINIVILNSFPIALYGELQSRSLDPLPWGGDTVVRVAGNMGNAIFIAAYLIMALYLALGKIAEIAVTALGIGSAPNSDQSSPTTPNVSIGDVVRLAILILIALGDAYVVMVLAGSRGPQLGLLAGLFFMVLLLMQLLRRRTVRTIATVSWIGLAVGALVVLVLLNFGSGSFIEKLRTLPVLNRLSTAFNISDGTNLVRKLIWDGNVQLMSPHVPIEMPDGTDDPWNAIRPLVGYGPESMYVAYNRFYPPALANIEARNASPDRSHNETWDSLVITGFVGFLAYLFLFGSVFYFGFTWIGLIASRFERILFWVLWAFGAAAGGIGAILFVSPSLLGVGVAGGIAFLGLLPFVIVSALLHSSHDDAPAVNAIPIGDRVLIIGLISAIVAHFVEIHLGIAIASTRTHFWGFAGLLVVLGLQWARRDNTTSDIPAVPEPTQASHTVAPVASVAAGGARRQRGQARLEQSRVNAPRARTASQTLPSWFNSVVIDGLLLGLILGVMAYDFMTNPDRAQVPGQVFTQMMTIVRGQTSLGVFAIFVLTWILGALMLVLDAQREGTVGMDSSFSTSLGALGVCLSAALLIWLAFGTLLAGRLVAFITATQQGVDGILGIANDLSWFPGYLYLLLALLMIAGAFLLANSEERIRPRTAMTVTGFAMLLLLVPVTLVGITASNLQSIRADIIYKQANPWDGQGATILQQGTNIQGWDLGLEHHRKAIQLAPNEDFYYLWLGRGLLEKAKSTKSEATQTLTDATDVSKIIQDGAQYWNRNATTNPLPSAVIGRDDLLQLARATLLEARRINPLNTDHSANLARMYRQSGEITKEPELKQQRFLESSKQYKVATTLSPQNAQLFNEWATLYNFNLGDKATAWAKLDQSLAIDQKFDQTYLLRGDMFMQEANAIQAQNTALATTIQAVPVSETVKLADLKAQGDKLSVDYRAKLGQAKSEFDTMLSKGLTNAQAFNLLTYIDQQLGDIVGAISVTNRLIELNPTDWNSYKNAAILYKDSGNVDKARELAQRSRDLAPADQKASLEAFIGTLKQ